MKKITLSFLIAIAIFEQSAANELKCEEYLKQGDAYLARAVRYSNSDSWQKPSYSYSAVALAYYKRYDICKSFKNGSKAVLPKKNHFKN
jgi:hypothetical protein